jgi:hypothetical protein
MFSLSLILVISRRVSLVMDLTDSVGQLHRLQTPLLNPSPVKNEHHWSHYQWTISKSHQGERGSKGSLGGGKRIAIKSRKPYHHVVS